MERMYLLHAKTAKTTKSAALATLLLTFKGDSERWQSWRATADLILRQIQHCTVKSRYSDTVGDKLNIAVSVWRLSL